MRAAHTLSGSLRVLGAAGAIALVGPLEALGREGRLEGAAALLARLEPEMERVRGAAAEAMAVQPGPMTGAPHGHLVGKSRMRLRTKLLVPMIGAIGLLLVSFLVVFLRDQGQDRADGGRGATRAKRATHSGRRSTGARGRWSPCSACW